MKIKIILSVIAFATIITACYNDSEEGLFPGSYIIDENKTCDTSNVTFALSIKPVIDRYCITCHSSQQPVLSSYTSIANNASSILSAIKREGSFPMPPKTKLDSCSVKKFEIWKNNGKPNN